MVVVEPSNEEGFYGPLLTRLKLCHGRDEEVQLTGPTESLKAWLAASRPQSPTAVTATAVAPTPSSSSASAESSQPRKKQRISASVLSLLDGGTAEERKRVTRSSSKR